MAGEITHTPDKASDNNGGSDYSAKLKEGSEWLAAKSKDALKLLKGSGSDALRSARQELGQPNLIKSQGQAVTSPAPAALPISALVSNGNGPLPLIEDDGDLVPLLRQASNEELGPLVEYIIGKGSVTAQLQRTQRYRQYSVSRDHSKYADDIAAEIQKFGANTFWTNTIRKGRGIKYRKIVREVAKRCGVKAGLWDETAEIEERVLAAVLSRAYEEMTNEQRRELLDTLKIQRLPGVGGPVAAGALQAAIRAAGFAPYKLAVIVANGTANAILGHGLAFAANAGLTKAVALFAGPVGWALDAVWGGMIAAGPAYRVTLPCVVQVALIRQSMLRKQREEKRKNLRVAGMVALIALAFILAILVARHFMRWKP
jgi:uncharacterized protein YaaW (UPF0174 family)